MIKGLRATCHVFALSCCRPNGLHVSPEILVSRAVGKQSWIGFYAPVSTHRAIHMQNLFGSATTVQGLIRLQINPQLLAFFVEMASLQAERFCRVRDVSMVSFELCQHRCSLKVHHSRCQRSCSI